MTGTDWIVVAGHRPDTVVPVFEAACQTYPLGLAQAPCPSTLMVRRSLYEQLGGFEAQFEGIYQLYEDQAFLAKCYTAAPVFMASETYCCYRQHDSSIVASVMKDGRYHEVRRFFLEWLQAYLGTHDLHHPQLDAKLRRARLRYGNPVERGFAWLLAGGIVYTVGALFYLVKSLPYNHAIWHLFVIAGSTLHFFSVLYTLPS